MSVVLDTTLLLLLPENARCTLVLRASLRSTQPDTGIRATSYTSYTIATLYWSPVKPHHVRMRIEYGRHQSVPSKGL
jgi:hypothetical protein